jgi:hypothetical protein
MSNGFPTAMPRLPDINPAAKSADMEREISASNMKQLDHRVNRHAPKRASPTGIDGKCRYWMIKRVHSVAQAAKSQVTVQYFR